MEVQYLQASPISRDYPFNGVYSYNLKNILSFVWYVVDFSLSIPVKRVGAGAVQNITSRRSRKQIFAGDSCSSAIAHQSLHYYISHTVVYS
jgi:hypothetical protein